MESRKSARSSRAVSAFVRTGAADSGVRGVDRLVGGFHEFLGLGHEFEGAIAAFAVGDDGGEEFSAIIDGDLLLAAGGGEFGRVRRLELAADIAFLLGEAAGFAGEFLDVLGRILGLLALVAVGFLKLLDEALAELEQGGEGGVALAEGPARSGMSRARAESRSWSPAAESRATSSAVTVGVSFHFASMATALRCRVSSCWWSWSSRSLGGTTAACWKPKTSEV